MTYAKCDTQAISLWSNIKFFSQKWVKYQCVHSLENEYHLILTLCIAFCTFAHRVFSGAEKSLNFALKLSFLF